MAFHVFFFFFLGCVQNLSRVTFEIMCGENVLRQIPYWLHIPSKLFWIFVQRKWNNSFWSKPKPIKINFYRFEILNDGNFEFGRKKTVNRRNNYTLVVKNELKTTNRMPYEYKITEWGEIHEMSTFLSINSIR